MAELQAYRLGVDPMHQEDAVAGMTSHSMEGGSRRPRTLEQRFERAGEQVRGVDGVARSIYEYQRVALDCEPFSLLTFPVAEKSVHRLDGQHDATAASRGLRGFKGLPPWPVMRARWT